MGNRILKKNKVGRPALLDFKTFYRAVGAFCMPSV